MGDRLTELLQPVVMDLLTPPQVHVELLEVLELVDRVAEGEEGRLVQVEVFVPAQPEIFDGWVHADDLGEGT